MGRHGCKGICKLKFRARPSVGNSKNKKHLPKCNVCCVRIDCDEVFCPCCRTQLSRRTVTRKVALVN